MRSDYFFGAGALLLAVAIVALLIDSNFPGTAETARGIFLVTLMLAPAVVGMTLMAFGAVQWYLERPTAKYRPE